MKILFSLLGLVLALSAGAQNYVPSAWTKTAVPATARAALGIFETNAASYNVTNTVNATNYYTVTNWGGLALNTIFVDATTGNDATGDGSPALPVATLAQGQALASSGDTVYGVRGVFAETGLHKTGVGWFFNRGVILTGNPTFQMNTNGESLNIGGLAAQNGGGLVSLLASNLTVRASLSSVSNAKAIYSSVGGSFNSVFITAESITNSAKFFDIQGTATNENFAVFLTVAGEFHGQFDSASSDTAQARTNRVYAITANPWRLNTVAAMASAKGTIVVGGSFNRDGKLWSINTGNQIVAWRGATLATTNALPGNSTNNSIGWPIILTP